MLKQLSIRTCVALFLVIGSLVGCASAPKFDDSLCTPYGGWGSCPTSYNTPNDTFPYIKAYDAIKALTFEQRLDYLGSIHKALMRPEAYNTHRARLLRDAEAPTALAMSEKDGAFVAMATMALTFGRSHKDEPFVDAAAAMSDPALVAAIQSRVPTVTGYDALDYGSQDEYVMVNLFKRLYADVIRAAEKGDPRSCELAAPLDLQKTGYGSAIWNIDKYMSVNAAALYENCAMAAIPSQAMYQHRVYLQSISKSAHRDDGRIESHKQAWVIKAVTLESKCRRVGVDPNQISYNRYSMQQVARDMQSSWDGPYQDGIDQEQYRERVAEHRYLDREAGLFSNGAVVAPLLTPYLYIAAVGHSCG